jgi:hypothetical protein
MNDYTPLAELQQWMLDAISAASSGDKAHQEQHARQTDTLILPSRQQTARERLSVYSHAYFARLHDVLRDLFPCLRQAVGDELFAEFAAGYLAAYPPTSYTLHRLADHFPEYLEATRPTDAPWSAFPVDLARLEQAIDRVFDSPGPEELPPFAFPASGASGEELRLALVPGLELLELRFPASSYFTAWKQGESVEWPQPAPQYVALFRRDYIVRRFELSRVQYVLVDSLAHGATLAEAIGTAAVARESVDATSQGSAPEPDLADALHEWFARWAAAGLFASSARPAPEAAAACEP